MEEEFEILTNPSYSVHKLGEQLLGDPDFSDVTLVCRDGQQIPAHRAVLSRSSLFLRQLFYDSLHQSTFLFLGSVEYRDLVALLNFMYLGSCTLSNKNKVSVTSLAAALEVEGWQKKEGDVPLAYEEDELISFKIEDIEAEEECINSKLIHSEDSAKSIGKQKLGEHQENLYNLPLEDEQKESHDLKLDNLATKDDKDSQKLPRINENVNEENVKKLGESKENMGNLPNFALQNGSVRPISASSIKTEEEEIEKKMTEEKKESIFKSWVIRRRKSTGKICRLPIVDNLESDANGKYPCNMCTVIYVTKDKLRSHKAVHHYGFTYDCNRCSSSFSARWRLSSHIASAHEGINMTCDSCKRNFKDLKSFEGHKLRKVSCDECDFIACHKIKLIIHKNLQHDPNNIDGTFKCSMCSFTTKKAKTLYNHSRYTHMGPSLSCENCEYTTLKSYALRIHIETVHLRITYSCKLCEYQTKNKLRLPRHVKTAHEGFRYKCNECNYDGPSPMMLRSHKKSKHQMIKNKCDQCDSVYETKESLRRHILEKHEGKTYKCKSCEYVARQPNLLTVHNATKHLNQYKFICSDCGYKTGIKSTFRVHLRNQHSRSLDGNKTIGSFKYKCCECDYQTKEKRLLSVHMNIYHKSSPGACCKVK